MLSIRQRLWIQVVASFLLFLSVGTIGLVFVLNTAFQRLSHAEFETLARSNAEFIRTLHFPLTDQLARYFSRIDGAEVRFGRIAAPDPHHEAVTVEVEAGSELTLIRERPTLRASLMRPVAIGTLLAFWTLWTALAFAVVRPYLRIQRLALLGQMTTGLAHEIRNPLSAIRLHGQLLAKADPTTSALIVDQASTIERLLNQWMFLARPEPPLRKKVFLRPLIEQTARLLAPTAEHACVRFQIDIPETTELEADAPRLNQVFHNIMLNAIQAMSTGGTLAISAQDHTITFADTGPGFSAKALTHWSEMLYSEKEGGMGVGLTVSREIIHAHGGELSIANRPEGGALVKIKFA